MARYTSPWDRSLKVSTALMVVVLVGAGAVMLLRSQGSDHPELARVLILAVVPFPLILLGVWALAPTGFSVETSLVRVERPLRPIEIPLREVRSVDLLPEGALRGAIRTFGASGAFGHYGRFRSRQLGPFRMYANRSSRLVRLVTVRGTFVLSPEPPDRFIQEVLSRSPAARSGGAA